jgi:hypothetical protein
MPEELRPRLQHTIDLCYPSFRGLTQPCLGFTFLFLNQLFRRQDGIVSCVE